MTSYEDLRTMYTVDQAVHDIMDSIQNIVKSGKSKERSVLFPSQITRAMLDEVCQKLRKIFVELGWDEITSGAFHPSIFMKYDRDYYIDKSSGKIVFWII